MILANLPKAVLLFIIANYLPLTDVFHPFHSPSEARLTVLGTEGEVLGEKSHCFEWGILMACNAVVTEGLPQAGIAGEGQMVPVMFVLLLGGWVLGNQAEFHCGVAMSRLCTSGVCV